MDESVEWYWTLYQLAKSPGHSFSDTSHKWHLWAFLADQSLIHLTGTLLILCNIKILARLSCGTKSNALWKYKYITSTQFPLTIHSLKLHYWDQICLTRSSFNKAMSTGNYIPILYQLTSISDFSLLSSCRQGRMQSQHSWNGRGEAQERRFIVT